MKTTRHLFLTLVACMAVLMAACSDDDGQKPSSGTIPDSVVAAFNSQYPDASNVSWEIKGEYAVASFTIDETRSSDAGRNRAWYHLSDGRWAMSDFDIPYAMLPEAVKTAFEGSEYAQSPWRIDDDDVEVITRHGYDETLYVIDVEKNENGTETEVELYYTADGILVNTIVDAERDNDHSDMLPGNSPTTITEWINQHFPGARIVDIDVERNGTEVEIIQDGMKHEIWFDASSAWVSTKTEYGWRNVPDVVQAFVQANYPDYRIDDVDRYETAANRYYCVEIERGDREKKIYLNEQGEEIGRPDAGTDLPSDGDTQVTTGIEAFIQANYPGAVIRERDYDDGRIEVDIIHDRREKEVLFNFREEWMRTTYDVYPDELPDAVKAALKAEFGEHAYWGNDDCECVETPEGTFYEVEVWDEWDVYLSAGGDIQWKER